MKRCPVGSHREGKSCVDNGVSEYDEWQGEIVRELEDSLDMTTSDAQGLVEAHNFEMMQSWAKGLDAKQTAKVIDRVSRVD